MNFVFTVADLLASLEFLGNVRISGCCDERREPIQPGDDAVLHLPCWHLTRPADDHRHAEAAFQSRSFATRVRSLATIGPGEVLRTIVSAEGKNGVLLQAVVL